ncbi:MAG: Flp family type IVb pilin [Bacillota bacterium]
MLQIYFWLRQLHVRQEGQSMVEYGLIISLIAAAVIVAIISLGSTLQAYYQDKCIVLFGQC